MVEWDLLGWDLLAALPLRLIIVITIILFGPIRYVL